MEYFYGKLLFVLGMIFLGGSCFLHAMQSSDEIEYEVKNFLLEENSVNNPLLKLVEKNKVSSRCRNCYFASDTAFKLSVILILLVQAICLYFLVNKLIDGCEKMEDKCGQCRSELTQCQEAYEVAKQLAQFVLKLWNECPAGEQDILNALSKFKKDCCNNTLT